MIASGVGTELRDSYGGKPGMLGGLGGAGYVLGGYVLAWLGSLDLKYRVLRSRLILFDVLAELAEQGFYLSEVCGCSGPFRETDTQIAGLVGTGTEKPQKMIPCGFLLSLEVLFLIRKSLVLIQDWL